MDGKNIPKIGSGQQKQPAEGGSKFPKLSKLPTAPSFTFPKKESKAAAQQKHAVAEIVSMDDEALNLDSTVKDVSRFVPADDEPTDVVSANEIMKAVAEMDAWDSIPSMNSVPSEIGSFSSIEMPKAAAESADVAKEVLSAEKTIASPVGEYEKQSEEVARGVLTAEATLSVPMNNYEDKSAASAASKSRESKKVSRVAPPEPARSEKPAPAPQSSKATSNANDANAQSIADNPEMSDEEKLQAMLDQMTPQERAEYEAYCAEQSRDELQRQREKQRELYEMYGNVSATGASNKAPIGLILVGVLICAGFLFAIIHFVTSDSSEPEATNETVADAEPVKAEPVRAEPLNTYSVTINRGAADDVFVNGVPVNGSTAQFVSNHRNTVIAYSTNMVPYFQTFDGKTEVTDPIDIQMVPDTLYAKGQISFRLTDRDITNGGLRVTFDGHVIGNFPGAIPDVVLGFPHILTLEKPGYAKHMHIIWGNDSNNTVTIPELKKEADVLSGTDCSLKKFPTSDKQYGVRIDTAGQSFSDPTTIATVPYGDIIEYYITREQRKPMQISVIPDGFGSMQMDVVLLHDSIGESVLSFENAKKTDIQVCLRRVGVLICPDMKSDTAVPSGNDWEFFAYQGEANNPSPIRGAQMQTLTANRKYVIEATRDERGLFKMNLKSATKVKDKDSKK